MSRELIDGYIAQLNHPKKAEIQQLLTIIRQTGSTFEESIKWNAPNFSFKGNDFLTFNFPPGRDTIMLVFHLGAKPKQNPDSHWIADDLGLLEWKSNDRAVLIFMGRTKQNPEQVSKLINSWISDL